MAIVLADMILKCGLVAQRQVGVVQAMSLNCALF